MRKSILLFILVLILGTAIFSNPISAATYNYGEALQKSIYFYECQQSGTLPSWNRARQWRGDSCLNDYVTGGWYDAGDHVKFGLPMAYTASMLGWALVENPNFLAAAGQKTILENNLRFTLDYLVRCDKGTGLVYQIGDEGTDHSLWVSAEMIRLMAQSLSLTGLIMRQRGTAAA